MQMEIETERLILRPLEPDDLDLAIALFTDPDVMQYLGPVETISEVHKGMPHWIKRAGGGAIGIWTAREKDGGAKIGTGVLLPLPIDLLDTDWKLMGVDAMPPGDIEVGYILRRSAWGHGYATEMCRALLQFAFEETDLPEIVAVTEKEHVVSRHVLEKCGMVFRGYRGAYMTETTDFAVTRAQWEALQGDVYPRT